jgi:thiamine biosynthesis lipoprotein
MRYYFFLLSIAALISCDHTIELQGETMGTTYSIKIVDNQNGKLKGKVLKTEIDELLFKINMQMSTYIPESEISHFNRSAVNVEIPVSSSFMEVLKLSVQINSESGGAFDPTVMPAVNLWGFGSKGRRNNSPAAAEINHIKSAIGMDKVIIREAFISKTNLFTELDFSAIAKGYGVDVVAEFITGRGFSSFMVEIGGEVVTRGKKRDGTPWRIGIDKPDIEPGVERSFQAIINISNVAVATSGDYRNYFIANDSLFSHTIDPLTCKPIVNGVASVTVIAPTCALADAIATAIMVMGEERGLQWVESKSDVETMIIVRLADRYRVSTSSGFEKYLSEPD